MTYGGFGGVPGFDFGGPGFGGGFGLDGPGFGFGGGFGFGRPEFAGGGPGGGFGFGGPGFGLKRAAFGTLALLLDGPADAAQIVQRTSEATGGGFTPSQEVAELAIGLLAGRGLVTVDGGVATLTELGNKVLSWRGISSETAHAFLARAGQFADVFKIRRELFEVAGLARTITCSGTDEQKAQLAQVRANVLTALTEAKKTLHGTLADN